MSRKNLEFKCFYNEEIRIFSEELLESNRKQGFSRNLKMFYGYTSPDSVHFHQWFWDSCFHAIVLSQFDPLFAIRELNTLFSVQEEDGFVPHIILWKWRIVDLLKPWWYREVRSKSLFYTAEIQPPVAGISLGYIYNRLKNKEVLEPLVDRVYRFYIYLSKHRDPDNDGLISIITPLESGMDMLPIYDTVLGNPDHDPMYQKRLIRQMLTFYKSIDWNLERVFNIREGFSRKDDTLPERLVKETPGSGPVKGQVFELDELLDQYYEARGWNKETGIPEKSKLEELGLEEAISVLQKEGKI